MNHKSMKSTEFTKTAESKNTIDNLSDKYINAVSSTDCTGLIPANPKTEEALESYKEIYNYEVPVAENSDRSNTAKYNKK